MPEENLDAGELGRRLRALRKSAGLILKDAAERTQFSTSLISRIETDQRTARPDQVRRLALAYGAEPTELAELLSLAEAHQAATRRVVVHRSLASERQKDIRALVEDSRSVRTLALNGVPDWLQTEAYARAVFTTGGVVTADDLAGLAERLAVIRAVEDGRRTFSLIAPEGALTWPVGGGAAMAEQMDHIARMSHRPNVRIGIIPLHAAGTATTLLPQNSLYVYDRTAVLIGTTTGLIMLNSEADIEAHLDLLEQLETLAVFGDEARDILAHMAVRYRAADPR